MCGRKCRRNSICSLSLFSTLGEHLKRIIVLNLRNFLNTSAPDYFFSGFHSRLFFSGFNCSPKNVCTCLPQNLSSAKKNSMRRKKLMKKWILVQNWRSPLGASLASCSRLFVHFGQKEFFTSSVFTFLHFVHFDQKKVFSSQDLYLHFCPCCPFSGMGDELTSGGNQNTELETFRRHSSKQS